MIGNALVQRKARKQRVSLSYLKCKYCRKHKQKCLPGNHLFPVEKCDRCIQKALPCSKASLAKDDRENSSDLDGVCNITNGDFALDNDDLKLLELDLSPPTYFHIDHRSQETAISLPLLFVLREVVNITLEDLKFLGKNMADLFKSDYAWLCYAEHLDSIFTGYNTFAIMLLETIAKHSDSGQTFLSLAQEDIHPKPISKTCGSSTILQLEAGHRSEDNYAQAFLQFLRQIKRYNDAFVLSEVSTVCDIHDQVLQQLQDIFENGELGRYVPEAVRRSSFLLMGHYLKKFLVAKNGYKPKWRDCLGRTPFHVMQDFGVPSEWTEEDMNTSDVLGRTALYLVAQAGDYHTVDLMLRNGAKPFQATVTKFTPLHVAAKLGHDRVCSILWEGMFGRRRNIVHYKDYPRDCADRSPFLCSILGGHFATVKFFIEKTMNGQEDVDAMGNTAIAIATRCGHHQIVEYLLQHNFPADKPDHLGRTPFRYAAQESQFKIMEILKNMVAVDQRDYQLRSPLAEAARLGLPDVVHFLLSLNQFSVFDNAVTVSRVDPNSIDSDGFSPLTHAVESGKAECVRQLVEHRPSIIDPNELHKGKSIAKARGHADILVLLVHGYMSRSAPNSHWRQRRLNIACAYNS